MKRAEFKPLLYTTTMRNPQRIKFFLKILLQFNNQILDDNLAVSIMKEVIKYGLYHPRNVSEIIKNKWNNNIKLLDNELNDIIENNIQDHKEAGFAHGWPSRFDTSFKIAKILGFVYYQPNSAIFFSELGIKLANSVDLDVFADLSYTFSINDTQIEQRVFLNSFSKDHRINPFIRVLNNNTPLILLLEVINKINNDDRFNGKGILRTEIPLLLYWKNHDSNALYERIVQLRLDNRSIYEPTTEQILDICLNEIMEGRDKVRDVESILTDYVDEFIRKMRLTGVISLRGNGRFLDINQNEIASVNNILRVGFQDLEFSNEREYFDYISTFDEELFTLETIVIEQSVQEQKLNEWSIYYGWENIKKELLILSNKNSSSKDDILKFINGPARLEFLISIAIKNKFNNINVIPNYPCDDEGLPTSTAGGNKGDIICIENENGVMVEVTLLQGRQQTIAEVWPIGRHLEEFKENISDSNCCFIAPTIFADSQMQIDYLKEKKELLIKPFTIKDFVDKLENVSILYNI